MDFLSKPRTWLVLGVSALGLFLLYQLWVWEIERIEVPPNKFLVVIKLWGRNLPPGEIVAPDKTYKGIQREVLKEGRWFLNPLLYKYEMKDVLEVPVGKCAILTRIAGDEIPPEDKARGVFLAAQDFKESGEGVELGQRGIIRAPLGPGKYYINPYEYRHELVDIVTVRAEQVGVKILKWGKDPAELKDRKSPYTVPEGYRGVQEKPLPPSDYYINPYVESIVAVDVRSHPVEFSDIYFPSRDGFTIQPHVMVAYKVNPEKAPELFVMLCDDGKLHQADSTVEDQRKNPILQKFVLPLIRGNVRIEGSNYDARDYVSQQRDDKNPNKNVQAFNPREQLQKALMKKVAPECEKVGVLIETITVAQPEMNKDLEKLASAIADREQARLTREKNKQLIEQHKQEQELKAKEALAEQRTLVVQANTKLEQEKIIAERRKSVEKAKLEAELKSAEARLEGAKERAKGMVTKAKNEAEGITAQNEAEVAGLKTAIGGFGSPEQYAQYHVLMKLSPALSEIFASDTSEIAKVFTTYMNTAPKKVTAAPGPAPAGASTADAKKPGG